MPSTQGKNLNLCFTKIKFPLSISHSSSSPLTPDDNGGPFPSSATTSSLLFKSYNSLYDSTFHYSTSKSLTHSPSLSSEPESDSDSEPDFATVFASQRFFFTSPGSSNSIIESTPSSIATTPESSDTLLGSSSSPINNANQSSNDGRCDQPSNEHTSPPMVKDSVAVPTFSPNPYMDFRRSMQEMVEARDLIDVKANWDYLHELLLCYLALNPKSTHKFIIGAFADLLVSLMAAEGGSNDGDVTEITGGMIPGQCM
ncbi:Ovate protein family [Theobroma cacao]|nr:Ovate protein family [Theobroma cacao]